MARISIFATPEKLYRYRSISDQKIIDRELSAIEQKYVYCPNISQMNDPMEGAHDANRFMRALKSYNKNIEEVRGYLDNSGIASFSETNLSEPMWAHYAGNFAGICVEYHLSSLAFHLPEENAIVRMQYTETPPTLRRNSDTSEERARMALSCKSFRWQAEREWRILRPSAGKAEYPKPAPNKVVTAVYVGKRMLPGDVQVVADRMHAIGIPIQMMRIDKYDVGFTLVPPPKPARNGVTEAALARITIDDILKARGGDTLA